MSLTIIVPSPDIVLPPWYGPDAGKGLGKHWLPEHWRDEIENPWWYPLNAAIGQRTATIDQTTPASTSHTVTKPTGLANGDVVYIWFANNGGSVSAAPTGFVQIAEELTQANPKYYLFRKLMTDVAGEGAWTFTTTSVTKTTICQAFTGVDQTTHEDTGFAKGTNSTGSNTMATSTGVTTATDGAVLVYGGAINSSSNDLTKDAAMTDIGETTGVKKQIVSYELRATAGATGTRAAAAVSNTLAWAAIMFAIRPTVATGDIHPLSMRQISTPYPFRAIQ